MISDKTALNQNLYFLKKNFDLMFAHQVEAPKQRKGGKTGLTLEKLLRNLRCLGSLPPLLLKLVRPRAARPVLFFDSASRTRTENGKKICVYSDYFLQKVNHLLCFSDSTESDVTYPSESKVINVVPLKFLFHLLARTLFRHHPDNYLRLFHAKQMIWRIIFRWLKPSKVLLVVWYCGKEDIVAAAKDLGIPVFELQHGYVSEKHPWYSIKGESNDASDYLLPDAILTYGNYWSEILIRSGWPANRIKTFGYYLNAGPDPCPNGFPEKFILISSQPGMEWDLADAALKVKQLYFPDLPIVVAAHPAGDAEDVYKALLGPDAKIHHKKSYDLLSQCTINVGVNSTLIWEAICFGKKSILTRLEDLPSHHQSSLIQCGIARPLSESIEDKFFSTAISSEIIEHFFKNPDFSSI